MVQALDLAVFAPSLEKCSEYKVLGEGRCEAALRARDLAVSSLEKCSEWESRGGAEPGWLRFHHCSTTTGSRYNCAGIVFVQLSPLLNYVP